MLKLYLEKGCSGYNMKNRLRGTGKISLDEVTSSWDAGFESRFRCLSIILEKLVNLSNLQFYKLYNRYNNNAWITSIAERTNWGH